MRPPHVTPHPNSPTTESFFDSTGLTECDGHVTAVTGGLRGFLAGVVRDCSHRNLDSNYRSRTASVVAHTGAEQNQEEKGYIDKAVRGRRRPEQYMFAAQLW